MDAKTPATSAAAQAKVSAAETEIVAEKKQLEKVHPVSQP